jgi:hypothetical protein
MNASIHPSERRDAMRSGCKRWITLALFCIVSFGVALLLSWHDSSAQGTPRVQYRVLDARLQETEMLEAELNEYGEAGWELVLVHIGNVTKPTPRLIFKRIVR